MMRNLNFLDFEDLIFPLESLLKNERSGRSIGMLGGFGGGKGPEHAGCGERGVYFSATYFPPKILSRPSLIHDQWVPKSMQPSRIPLMPFLLTLLVLLVMVLWYIGGYVGSQNLNPKVKIIFYILY
jgi:hypothetical protein